MKLKVKLKLKLKVKLKNEKKMLEEIVKAQNKLKKTETVVREMPKGNFEEEEERVPLQTQITSLFLTVNWAVYKWLGPKKEIRKVLITPKYNREKMKEEDISQYEHIEWVDKYDSPLVEWKAYQLHQKYKFDSVKIQKKN